MSRRRVRSWTPERVGTSDQILAILRDNGPMTATEIGKQLGYVRFRECSDVYCGTTSESSIWRCDHFGNGLDLVVRTGRLADHVGHDLVPMLNAGLVSRKKIGSRVYWSAECEFITLDQMPEVAV